MTWNRKVTGVQTHHLSRVRSARDHWGALLAALQHCWAATGDQRYADLLVELQTAEFGDRLSDLVVEVDARYMAFHDADYDAWKRCRDGHEPWPDEDPDGFVPRHTCHDRCLHTQVYKPGHPKAGQPFDHPAISCLCDAPPCRACAVGHEYVEDSRPTLITRPGSPGRRPA